MRYVLSLIFFCFLFTSMQAFAVKKEGEPSEKTSGKMEATDEDIQKDNEEIIKDFINRVVERETELIKQELGETLKEYWPIKVRLSLKLKSPNVKKKKILKKKGISQLSYEQSWLLLASIYDRDPIQFQRILDEGLADPNAQILVHVELRLLRGNSIRRQTSQPRHPLFYAVSIAENTEATHFVNALIEAGAFFNYASQNGILIFDRTLSMNHFNILGNFLESHFITGRDLGMAINLKLESLLKMHKKYKKLFFEYKKQIAKFKTQEDCPSLVAKCKKLQNEYPYLCEPFYDFFEQLLLIGAEGVEGADCRFISGHGSKKSALHYAILIGDAELVSIIIEYDPSLLDLRDDTHLNAMDTAILEFETQPNMDLDSRRKIIDSLLLIFEHRYNDDGTEDHPLSTSFLTASRLKDFKDFEFVFKLLMEKIQLYLSANSELDEDTRERLRILYLHIRGFGDLTNPIRNIFEGLITNASLSDLERSNRIKFLLAQNFHPSSFHYLFNLAIKLGLNSVIQTLIPFIRGFDLNMHIDTEFQGETFLALAIRTNASSELIVELIEAGANQFHHSVLSALNMREVNLEVRTLVEGYQLRERFRAAAMLQTTPESYMSFLILPLLFPVLELAGFTVAVE